MGASRQFLDSFGFSWQVLEIAPESRVPATEQGWLYFLSRGTTRRLRAYPADWTASGWSELEELCASAEVVGTDAGSRPLRAVSDRERTRANA